MEEILCIKGSPPTFIDTALIYYSPGWADTFFCCCIIPYWRISLCKSGCRLSYSSLLIPSSKYILESRAHSCPHDPLSKSCASGIKSNCNFTRCSRPCRGLAVHLLSHFVPCVYIVRMFGSVICLFGSGRIGSAELNWTRPRPAGLTLSVERSLQVYWLGNW